MLANIESRLEECVRPNVTTLNHICFSFLCRYISLVESLPPAFVEEAEKTKEKERRQVRSKPFPALCPRSFYYAGAHCNSFLQKVRDAKIEEEQRLQAVR